MPQPPLRHAGAHSRGYGRPSPGLATGDPASLGTDSYLCAPEGSGQWRAKHQDGKGRPFSAPRVSSVLILDPSCSPKASNTFLSGSSGPQGESRRGKVEKESSWI